MRLKKLLASSVMTALLVTSLTACGGSTGTSGAKPSGSDTSGKEDASKYEVTKPIKIEWWHALEQQYQPTLDKVVKDFESKNPNIDVEAVYQGSYADLNKKLIAAQAAGTTLPALSVVEVSLVAEYGSSGVCEVLDPYIKATKYDVNDYGDGFKKAAQYDGKQVALPFQNSCQIMYYNKDMAKAEGITIPTKWSEMDAFMKKAAKINNGKTERYASIIPGWGQWYFEMFFINNGVSVISKDGKSTDLNSEKALSIAKQIQKWHQDGTGYYAYGKDASANMRQNFLDGKAFSCFHTIALYNTYKEKAKFEVGMAWLPAGDTDKAEIGGNVLIIPAKNSQEVKNAAWALMQYVTNKDNNLLMAVETGYMPTKKSILQTEEGKKFLKEKPAYQVIFDHIDKIYPTIQHEAYSQVAKTWMESLAKATIENVDMKSTMDNAKKLIDDILAGK